MKIVDFLATYYRYQGPQNIIILVHARTLCKKGYSDKCGTVYCIVYTSTAWSRAIYTNALLVFQSPHVTFPPSWSGSGVGQSLLKLE